MTNSKSYLLGFYTKSPLHVGSGTSVDIVDLPITRERITNYPVIPGSAVKGVLRQRARDCGIDSQEENTLFGNENGGEKDLDNQKIPAYAGAMSFGEAKLLAWPVRSLKECFVWITCPLALKRFARDTGKDLQVPDIALDSCIADAAVISGDLVVLEEYPLAVQKDQNIKGIIEDLKGVSDDLVWTTELPKRLVVVNDENFQHFVTTTTEIVARIAIDPKTRTNTALFNQENTPSETLYYSICTYLGERAAGSACATFDKLFEDGQTIIQFGGNETIGLGLCEVKKSMAGRE